MADLSVRNVAVAALYIALFNRAPDADGFAFWTEALANGASLETLSEGFLIAPEAATVYPPGQTGAQFVTSFYVGVFGRAPDPEGLAFWTGVLAANGGENSLSARSELVGQITEIVSTPLTSKPPGISDEAYAQTLADRARFANQIEFSVYFATELRSNDVALAKSTIALITDQAASLTTARDVAVEETNGGGGSTPIPPLNFSRADTATAIQDKLAAYAGKAATADVSGMDVDQLSALLSGQDKIADSGLTGTLTLDRTLTQDQLSFLLGAKVAASASVLVDAAFMTEIQLATVAASSKVSSIENLVLSSLDTIDGEIVSSLLSKASGGQVDATGASAEALSILFTHMDKLAVDGITGDLVLTDAQTAGELTALLGAKTAMAANVHVDATFMHADQLAAVAASDKVDSIENLVLTSLDVTEDALASSLLAKATGARVDATAASNAVLSTIVTYADNIAADGITGSVALSKTQTVAELTALLGAKTAMSADVSIDAASMSAQQLKVVGLQAAKVDSIVNLADLDLADIGDAELIGLLSKAVDATVVATGASLTAIETVIANLSRIAINGITGDLQVVSAFSGTDISALFDRYAGASAVVNAAGMSQAQLATVATSAAAADKLAAGGITGMSLALGDAAITGSKTADLLSKSSGAQVTATGASADEVAALVSHLDKIAVGGISGTLLLSNALSDTDMGSLLGAKIAASATINVDAKDMTVDQLVFVADNIGKFTQVSNLSLPLGQLADDVTSTLLAAADANSVKVDANGASTAELTSLFGHLGNVADQGITGVINVSLAQFQTLSGGALDSKLAVGSEPVLRVSGTSGRDEISLAGWSSGVRVDGGSGGDKLTLGPGADTVFIGSRTESHGSPQRSDTDTNNIETIYNIGADDVMRFSSAPDAFGSGVTLNEGPVRVPFAMTNAVDVLTFGQVIDFANDLASIVATYDPISGPYILRINSYTYNNGVTPGGLANKTFIILANVDSPVTVDSTIIAIDSYTSIVGIQFEAGL